MKPFTSIVSQTQTFVILEGPLLAKYRLYSMFVIQFQAIQEQE